MVVCETVVFKAPELNIATLESFSSNSLIMPNHSSNSASEDEDFLDDEVADKFKITNGISTQFDLSPLKASSALLTLEELNSPENEIWIITAPKSLNTMKMHDFSLPLKPSSDLKVGDFEAETIVDNHNNQIALLLPNKKGNLKLTVKKTEGSIKIVENIPVPKLQPAQISACNTVRVHENLVCRHPLYSKSILDSSL